MQSACEPRTWPDWHRVSAPRPAACQAGELCSSAPCPLQAVWGRRPLCTRRQEHLPANRSDPQKCPWGELTLLRTSEVAGTEGPFCPHTPDRICSQDSPWSSARGAAASPLLWKLRLSPPRRHRTGTFNPDRCVERGTRRRQPRFLCRQPRAAAPASPEPGFGEGPHRGRRGPQGRRRRGWVRGCGEARGSDSRTRAEMKEAGWAAGPGCAAAAEARPGLASPRRQQTPHRP